MRPIKLKNWIISILFLIGLGLIADYYFLHVLFHQKNQSAQEVEDGAAELEGIIPAWNAPAPGVLPKTEDNGSDEEQEPDSAEDNFLENLQKCSPEAAAKNVISPDDFVTYLKEVVGIEKQETDIENYHLRLTDGSVRRVHVTVSDSSNDGNRKEIRLFKLDDEGYPERLPLKKNQTLAALLDQGEVFRKELRGRWELRDGTHLAVEMHNDSVFEFQYKGDGKILSCRLKKCLCQ